MDIARAFEIKRNFRVVPRRKLYACLRGLKRAIIIKYTAERDNFKFFIFKIKLSFHNVRPGWQKNN